MGMVQRSLVMGVCLIFCVSGCESQMYLRKVKFLEEEYAPYDEAGTGRIEGQAFLKTLSGDVKYGAGNNIYLNPATSYSDEWFNFTVHQWLADGSQRPYNMTRIEEPDYRALKYHKIAVADAWGRFEFENLPSGEYYIVCDIYWVYSTQYVHVTGARVGRKVKVKDGETVKVIVTQ